MRLWPKGLRVVTDRLCHSDRYGGVGLVALQLLAAKAKTWALKCRSGLRLLWPNAHEGDAAEREEAFRRLSCLRDSTLTLDCRGLLVLIGDLGLMEWRIEVDHNPCVPDNICSCVISLH